eukprot:NODE_16_length_49026_cov_1.035992.p19 type:complete len:165 gc:universal NODE_16_length_49026_cov_1.035992:41232-41726(+)
MSEEAADLCSQLFVEMRNLGRQYGNIITATMRQMMSMMRLSEAHAKVHLRNIVLEEDVREAHRLIQVALKQSATDPKTGRINMSLLNTGYSVPDGDESHLSTALIELMKQSTLMSFNYRDLYRLMSQSSELSRREFDVVLNTLDVNQQIHWDKSHNIIKLLTDE